MTSRGHNPIRGDRFRRPRWDRLYWHLRCLRREIETIRDQYLTTNRGRLVDFGNGNMPYRPLLEPYVEQYQGADLTGSPLAEIAVNEQGRVEGLADASSDFVLSNQVLEHVPDPASYLSDSEARRLLKPAGLLFLSTHGTWRYHPDPNDYWRWTSDGLSKITREQGFEISSFRGVMGPMATAIQLFLDGSLGYLPRPLQPVYTYPLQCLMQLADAITPRKTIDQDACVYILVARRIR